jgi:hypothetical protein
MDVHKILEDLRREREHIEEAILTLERLATGRGRRRGRPPLWMKQLKSVEESSAGEAKKRGRPPGSKNKAKEAAGG